ncbi:hypothetical protein GQ53DRAFT_337754 [Thozetella sp. PMI_491]|nr:hypothetical protein GQ53DRAFT_337754 [Thozetella sp. PMI_491]
MRSPAERLQPRRIEPPATSGPRPMRRNRGGSPVPMLPARSRRPRDQWGRDACWLLELLAKTH